MENSLILSLSTSAILALILVFKSFFSEKGKNLATKQDIGEITKKVEEVKVLYLKEIEELKSELQTSVHHKNKLTDLSIDTLLELYDTILKLTIVNLKKSYHELNINNIEEEIFNLHTETDKLFWNFHILYHKLIIYITNNEELLVSLIELMKKLNPAWDYYVLNRYKLSDKIIEDYKSLKHQSNFDYIKCIKLTKEFELKYENEFSPLYKKLNSALTNFAQELTEHLISKNIIIR